MLELCNLFFFFLFCRGLKLRDCLESKKDLECWNLKQYEYYERLQGLFKLEKMHVAWCYEHKPMKIREPHVVV